MMIGSRLYLTILTLSERECTCFLEIMSVALHHVHEIYEQKGSNIIILYLIVNLSCRQPH